ncbi:MAG: hypothetical protein MK193_01935 [Lentisphaeria bacterium]|nr:hypothetical protein [Lentisphaeria bacterium]
MKEGKMELEKLWKQHVLEWSASLSIPIPEGWTQKVFGVLDSHYSDKCRDYHNWNHIKDCLNLIQKHEKHIDNLHLIRFTAWFHDIIYVPGAKDNESKSATFAGQLMGKLDTLFARNLVEMVKWTDYTTVDVKNYSLTMRLFHDIDHFSFAKNWREYKVDSLLVLKELGLMEYDPHYLQGRLTYLKNLKNKLFLSTYFDQKYSIRATTNIERSIKEIQDIYGICS